MEPPAKRTAIHRRKFPAGICEFGIAGWLCHVFTFLGHLGLKQLVVMTASVPTCLGTSSGFSALLSLSLCAISMIFRPWVPWPWVSVVMLVYLKAF